MREILQELKAREKIYHREKPGRENAERKTWERETGRINKVRSIWE